MDLPHRAVAVYTYLHDRANKNGACQPSVKTKAGDIKLSPATVHRADKDLKKAGLIELSSVIVIRVEEQFVVYYKKGSLLFLWVICSYIKTLKYIAI